MKHMTGTDSLFLSLETPSWHQHVGGLTILDPGDLKITFDDAVRTIEDRLPSAPKFRWKLKTMPLGLARPVWVDDPDFDIRRHVRRIAVPAPGGKEETAEVCGMILSSQLHRSRPLWELWFLEGIANGRVGMLMKYHHCLLDGMAGASLATALLDVTPDATGALAPPPPPDEQTAGPAPSGGAVAAHVAGEVVKRPLRIGRYAIGGVRKVAAMVSAGARNDESRALLHAPVTPFNAAVGPRRSLAFTSVAMDDLKALKVHHDVKLNDVVLALVAGSLRKYLLDLDVLPDVPLVCAVPVSTRVEGDTTQDNQISTMYVRLGTHIEDPVQRLLTIHASSQSAKAMQQAISAHKIQSLGDVASPLILSTAIRALYRTEAISRSPGRINTLVSNVPGPPIPLYTCGARMTGMFPSSVIIEGIGLNTTVISYMDRLDFGLHVDPDVVPDPWIVAHNIRAALAELKKASGLGAVTEVQDPFGDTTADEEASS